MAAVRSSRRTPGRSGRRDAGDDVPGVRRSGRRRRCRRRSGRGTADVAVPVARGEHVAAPGRATSAISSGGDDGVDEAVREQVLGGLHALGERLAVQRLVDPRAEEADQRARLGDGHVAERPPGGQHPAGRRGAQVDQVGQPGLLVRGDRRGDPDHLHERDRALLHPGAAGDRRGQQRQPLARWPARPRRPAARRRRTPIEPARKPNSHGHDGHPAAAQQALAGEHRLVGAAALGRRGRSSAAYAAVDGAGRSGGASQETNEPASTVRTRNSRALGRSTPRA